MYIERERTCRVFTSPRQLPEQRPGQQLKRFGVKIVISSNSCTSSHDLINPKPACLYRSILPQVFLKTWTPIPVCHHLILLIVLRYCYMQKLFGLRIQPYQLNDDQLSPNSFNNYSSYRHFIVKSQWTGNSTYGQIIYLIDFRILLLQKGFSVVIGIKWVPAKG